jgi:hypothetical protein
MQSIQQPWPWYVAGPLIGLMVPLLLFVGNKTFGVSSSLRHFCAACFSFNIPFFKYQWKKEIWNLVFVAGIILGAWLAYQLLWDHQPVQVNSALANELSGYSIHDYNSLAPAEIFNWNNLLTLKGLLFMVAGGFLVGFGTRYAGGCTSGHSIMGLSNLQWPSLLATICFLAGGFIMANLILPYLFKL